LRADHPPWRADPLPGSAVVLPLFGHASWHLYRCAISDLPHDDRAATAAR
jgi:hypothetical protein